jgi:hypothetical protein
MGTTPVSGSSGTQTDQQRIADLEKQLQNTGKQLQRTQDQIRADREAETRAASAPPKEDKPQDQRPNFAGVLAPSNSTQPPTNPALSHARQLAISKDTQADTAEAKAKKLREEANAAQQAYNSLKMAGGFDSLNNK